MNELHLGKLLSSLNTKQKNGLSEHLENCKIFFADKACEAFNDTEYVDDLELKDLDLPFECCWFQSTDNLPLVVEEMTIKKEQGQIGILEKLYKAIMGILVIEAKPMEYMYIPYIEVYADEYCTKLLHSGAMDTDTDMGQNLKVCCNIVDNILVKLKNSNNTIFVKENYRYKYKKDNKKHTRKINEVIYITSNPKKVSSICKNNIVQKCGHRFDVRGHWRQINGIGKDRQGEYIVENYTWVKPCVKGDESLPYIAKTRILK